MRNSTGIAFTLATAISLGAVTLLAQIARAEDASAQATYKRLGFEEMHFFLYHRGAD